MIIYQKIRDILKQMDKFCPYLMTINRKFLSTNLCTNCVGKFKYAFNAKVVRFTTRAKISSRAYMLPPGYNLATLQVQSLMPRPFSYFVWPQNSMTWAARVNSYTLPTNYTHENIIKYDEIRYFPVVSLSQDISQYGSMWVTLCHYIRVYISEL